MRIDKKRAVVGGLAAAALLAGGFVGAQQAFAHTATYYIVTASDTSFDHGTTATLYPQCDAGDYATGGGIRIGGATGHKVQYIYNNPLYGAGDDPIGWEAYAENQSTSIDTVMYAYAVCKDT